VKWKSIVWSLPFSTWHSHQCLKSPIPGYRNINDWGQYSISVFTKQHVSMFICNPLQIVVVESQVLFPKNEQFFVKHNHSYVATTVRIVNYFHSMGLECTGKFQLPGMEACLWNAHGDILSHLLLECGTTCKLGQNLAKFSKILKKSWNIIFAAQLLLKTGSLIVYIFYKIGKVRFWDFLWMTW